MKWIEKKIQETQEIIITAIDKTIEKKKILEILEIIKKKIAVNIIFSEYYEGVILRSLFLIFHQLHEYIFQ